MKHWIHIGTQRGGSSFLRSLLAQVPDVALARRQELHFFGYEEDHRYETYLACFPEKSSVLFENSPTYFRDGHKCAGPLAETLAGKPLMLSLLLRDPVEAIISHHDLRLRQGFFKRPHNYAGDPCDLGSFVRRNPHYLDPWRYMDLLEDHWLRRFPVERFAIRTFEEFTSRPIETLRDFAAQAGLNGIGDVRPDKAWKNARPASGLAHRLVMASGRIPAVRAMRRRAMAIPIFRNLAERILFDESRSVRREHGRMAELKAELSRYFADDVSRLCTFLGRRALPWNNFYKHPQDAGSRVEATD